MALRMMDEVETVETIDGGGVVIFWRGICMLDDNVVKSILDGLISKIIII